MDPVSVDVHLAEVLAGITPLLPTPHPLLEAIGLPLVADVVAPRGLPAFDNSAMDGYAVKFADVVQASIVRPVTLEVLGDVHAGDAPTQEVRPGATLRIMTGAPIPPGADTVVPLEWTDGGATTVEVRRAPVPGQHLRHAGEDVRAGDVIVRAGDLLGPRQIGAVAGVGIGEVTVAPRPRVVVMSTGAELVEPGKELRPGSIHDANSFLLAAAVRATGAVAYRVRAVADDVDAFREALDDQLVRADVVVTSGGVSKGTRDVVKAALREEPGMTFREVAMQPGKPQGFGHVGSDRTPLFALPGNPVSSYVSFEVFVAPALRRLAGREPVSRPMFAATLTETVTAPPARRTFLRGRVVTDADGTRVSPVGGAGSHLLGGLAGANALIVLDEDREKAVAGETVPVMLLDREF